MASNPIKSIPSIAKFLLGLIFLFFGLNYFFHFLPSPPPPDPASPVALFSGGLAASSYFFVFLKSLETIIGILLILNLFTPLVVLILPSISINILLFHLFLTGASTIVLPLIILLLNIYLIWHYRHLYYPLLKTNKAVEEAAPRITVA
ncbi:MAG: DoxX family membrane protein [Agriterribacter sp.]